MSKKENQRSPERDQRDVQQGSLLIQVSTSGAEAYSALTERSKILLSRIANASVQLLQGQARRPNHTLRGEKSRRKRRSKETLAKYHAARIPPGFHRLPLEFVGLPGHQRRTSVASRPGRAHSTVSATARTPGHLSSKEDVAIDQNRCFTAGCSHRHILPRSQQTIACACVVSLRVLATAQSFSRCALLNLSALQRFLPEQTRSHPSTRTAMTMF